MWNKVKKAKIPPHTHTQKLKFYNAFNVKHINQQQIKDNENIREKVRECKCKEET